MQFSFQNGVYRLVFVSSDVVSAAWTRMLNTLAAVDTIRNQAAAATTAQQTNNKRDDVRL